MLLALAEPGMVVSSSRWSWRPAAFDGVLLAGRTVRRWDSKNSDGEHRRIKRLTRFSAGLGLMRAGKASIDSFPLTPFLFMLDWILFCTCSQIGNCCWLFPKKILSFSDLFCINYD
jgi:hypothetical protein